MSLNSTHFTVVEDSFYDHRFWVVDDDGDQWAMGPGLDSAALGAAQLIAKAASGEVVASPLAEAYPHLAAPKPLASLLGSQVRVYRNVTRKCWSVQYREAHIRPDNGRVSYRWQVAGHDQAVCLQDVHFQVSGPGRERVLATGKKEVHAYAIGTLVATGSRMGTDDGAFYRLAGLCKQEVGYNPRKSAGPHFTRRHAQDSVAQAGHAFLDGSGHLWIDRKHS